LHYEIYQKDRNRPPTAFSRSASAPLFREAKVQELGGDARAVQALPLGTFISWNRLSGGKILGKVF
jgi:hypothetical protein